MALANAKILRNLLILLALLVLAVLSLLAAVNTRAGLHWLEQTIIRFSSGQVALTGLNGPLPRHLALEHLELRDANGAWISLENAQIDWNLSRLLAGEIRLDNLSAERLAVNRPPPPGKKTEAKPAPSLPLAVTVGKLAITRLDLAAAVAGSAASLNVEGDANVAALDRATINLLLQRLGGSDQYRLNARVNPDSLDLTAAIAEDRHGLLASLAHLQQPYPINLEARLQGPLSAIASQARLRFGPLQATAQGNLDFHGDGTNLEVNAHSAALELLPELSWQTAELTARISGPLAQPGINGNLDIAKLSAPGARLGKIKFTAESNAGSIQVTGELDELKSAKLGKDLLLGHPLKLGADFNLASQDKPLVFSLRHPFFNATGKATLAEPIDAQLALALTDLKALSALAGQTLSGKAEFNVNARRQDQTFELNGDGELALSGGNPQILGLLGKHSKLALAARGNGADLELTKLELTGGNLKLSGQGQSKAGLLNGDLRVALADLAPLAEGLAGKLELTAQIVGPTDDFQVGSELTGALGYQAGARRPAAKPVTGKLQLKHLPKAAEGRLDGRLWLAGAPLTVAAAAQTSSAGLRLELERAGWQSARLQGRFTVPPAANFALGELSFKMPRLADLQPLLSMPLSGGLTGTVATRLDRGRPAASVYVQADQLKLENRLSVTQTTLTVAAGDLLSQPRLNGAIKLDGIDSSALSGGTQLTFAGPLSALNLNWNAALTDSAGQALNINAAAVADSARQRLQLDRFQADWRQQTLALRQPARLSLAGGVNLDRLSLGLGKATLDISGQFGPRLDCTAEITHLPASLLALANAGLEADGELNASAKLTGTSAKPMGNVDIKLTDLKLRTQKFILPTTQLAAEVLLNGVQADLSGHAKIGTDSQINIDGQLPLAQDAPFKLHAAADLNLKLTDPMLNAGGRRMRGQAKLLADVTGNPAAPSYTGSLQLDKTELRDYTLGLNITGISATARADNGQLKLERFQARAGQGQINGRGSVNLVQAGMPVDMAITADKAQLLASDRLSVNLDSDLKLNGEASNKLSLLGSVLINRAEIRVPERLPTSIAVLKLQTKASKEQPAPAANAKVLLNLTINAPGNIFVRGRGLDAELYGTVRLTGPAGQVQPEGVFKLRRGQFSLAGKTLNFSEGSVSFDGGSLTNPSLHFVASSYSDNITATLTVGGTANKPKISLSSVPALPQDEILARLLFNNSTANLSVTEMIQIGSALASLSGADSGLGDPLEDVRKTLGLDRLSVGTSLEAGRYLAPGVYLGAKQGLTGNNPQAIIQIDLTKQLKLEALVGAGTSTGNTPNPNSVGIIYQYEY